VAGVRTAGAQGLEQVLKSPAHEFSCAIEGVICAPVPVGTTCTTPKLNERTVAQVDVNPPPSGTFVENVLTMTTCLECADPRRGATPLNGGLIDAIEDRLT
jgi:hypothetical protein